MVSELQNLKENEVKLLFKIFEKLSLSLDQDTLRQEIVEDMLRLLKADFFASYIWNPEKQIYEQAVFFNMSPSNIARYESYYQFHDPITPSLQKRRRATLVSEVMPQKELEKTEFFNDFLMADGLHNGINLFVYEGDLNIGDLRIWRAKGRSLRMGKREVTLLEAIKPYFRNALRNASVFTRAQKRSELWGTLLEKLELPLFLFDSRGNLIYRNIKAGELEESLSKETYLSLFSHIQLLAAKSYFLESDWKGMRLSVLRASLPYQGQSSSAIIVHSTALPKIDHDFICAHYGLSSREAEICLLIFKGLTDKQIASVLGIGYYTVRTHLKHIFFKLDVTNRSELIYILLEGIVDISL